MPIFIQHNTDLDVANKIAKTYNATFQVYNKHLRFTCKTNIDLAALRSKYQLDFNYLPAIDFSQIKLFISDMDSTLIDIECIDEIADFAFLKPQVADITERCMRGELDFDTGLIERTALLKNLDESVLNKVYTERLHLSPGADILIVFLKTRNILCATASGGFDYFTKRLASDIGLDYNLGNQLEIKNGKLTGKVYPPIINAQSKADFVVKLAAQCLATPNQIIVVGDGANDLPMMKKAGLSIAYHAKPLVIKYANIIISFGGLDKIKDFFDV